MLMRSGNDAAVALADAYGYQRTLAAMNAEAARIGATNTTAKSPNGLDQPGQVTTAADLACRSTAWRFRDPRLQEILTAKQAEFPDSRRRIRRRPAATSRSSTTTTSSIRTIPVSWEAERLHQPGGQDVCGRRRTGWPSTDRRAARHRRGTTQTAGQLLDWSFANADRLSPIGQLQRSPGRRHHPPNRRALRIPTMSLPFRPRRRTRP